MNNEEQTIENERDAAVKGERERLRKLVKERRYQINDNHLSSFCFGNSDEACQWFLSLLESKQ